MDESNGWKQEGRKMDGRYTISAPFAQGFSTRGNSKVPLLPQFSPFASIFCPFFFFPRFVCCKVSKERQMLDLDSFAWKSGNRSTKYFHLFSISSILSLTPSLVFSLVYPQIVYVWRWVCFCLISLLTRPALESLIDQNKKQGMKENQIWEGEGTVWTSSESKQGKRERERERSHQTKVQKHFIVTFSQIF